MEIPVKLVGQAYKHRNLPLSQQTSKNWYPEFNKEAEAIISMQPWPGLTSFSTISGSADGGMHTFNGVLYKVSDTTLYSVNSSGTETSIGAIAGSGLCSFDSDEVSGEMAIVRQGNAYTYNGTTLTTENDVDFDSPNYVSVIKRQAIYDRNDGRFGMSNVDDFGDLNSLDATYPQLEQGDFVRPFVHNETIHMMGDQAIKNWYYTGTGRPPVKPYQSTIISVGVLSGNSVASNDNFVYFLGSDYNVYQMAGNTKRPISEIPIAQAIKGYTNASTSIGYCLSFNGQKFYVLRSDGDACWVYNETAGGWFELTTETAPEVAYKVTSHTRAYGYDLMGVGANIFRLDDTVFENGTERVAKERISFPLTGGALGPQYQGREIQINKVTIIMSIEPAASGDGSSPRILFAYSNNSGRTWTSRNLDATGSDTYNWEFETHQLGKARSFIFRIRNTDPVFSSILGCTADVELGLL